MSLDRAYQHRQAFTLIEMLVVIVIIVVLASLAAAFMPRVQDSTTLSNGMDQLSQWLLTAKMRTKRDGLASGIRLIPDVNNMVTQFQYIQQPDPLAGVAANATGTLPVTCGQPAATAGTTVTFTNADFSLGGLPQYEPITGLPQWLVQIGDYLELRDSGGIHAIVGVTATTVTVSANQVIVPTGTAYPWTTSNYRILRQPRPLIGESHTANAGQYCCRS